MEVKRATLASLWVAHANIAALGMLERDHAEVLALRFGLGGVKGADAEPHTLEEIADILDRPLALIAEIERVGLRAFEEALQAVEVAPPLFGLHDEAQADETEEKMMVIRGRIFLEGNDGGRIEVMVADNNSGPIVREASLALFDEIRADVVANVENSPISVRSERSE